MPTTEERVDRLEAVFASFMERTDEALADIRASTAEIRASTAEIRASTAEIRASNLRTDAQLLEMQRQADKDRQQAEKDRKDFNKRLAELSDSMGTLVEDMVAPNARRIASENFPSDPVIRLAQRVRQVHPVDRGRMIEIDLLAGGQRHVMVVEGKWRLNADKIREFVEKVNSLPEFMPEYTGYVLVPVVASITIEPSVIAFLNRQKVYGVAMGDETMELVNLGQF
ncbi:MAG: hypothetical protein AB9869_28890 [Verrucomicrobiia bacterium]